MKKSLILAALLGSMVALGAVAATTDEIIRLVYDSGNTAFRIVNFDGSPIGGGNSDLEVGTTTVTDGGDKFCLFDDGGTVGADDACQIDKVAGSLSNLGVDVANAITLGDTAGCITFEGATADANESLLCPGTLLADYTFNLPTDVAGTLTLATRGANTFTGRQTISSSQNIAIGSESIGGITGRTANTPDVPFLFTGTLSNAWHFAEAGDVNADLNNGPCGTSACTDPTFIGHSRNQSTTEYFALDHDTTRLNLTSGTGPVGLVPASTFGVQLDTTGTKVTCDATNRGSLFYEAGGAGVADVVYVCGKDTSDVYSWHDISGPIT